MVKVYSVGNFSKEVCGGPHVDFTGSLGQFKIVKEEGAANDVRRVYAVLTKTNVASEQNPPKKGC
jgi:alanyl-tRNA synthetase